MPPAPLTEQERLARFPRGKTALARKLNHQGFRLRSRHEPGALEAYAEAVRADPSFPLARFNLACELALAGRREEALEQLTALYLMKTPGAAQALLGAEADPDLRSLHGEPRLLALLDAVSQTLPLTVDLAAKPTCSGWSASDGTVVCGWFCATVEWPPVQGIVLYQRGQESVDLNLPSEFEGREEARQARAEAARQLAERRVPARQLPRWKLSLGQSVQLEGGYAVRWSKRTLPEGNEEHSLEVTGPGGKSVVPTSDLIGCPQPITFDTPEKITAYLVARLDLVVLVAEYLGSCCDETAKDNESWSAMAFVHPGEQQAGN